MFTGPGLSNRWQLWHLFIRCYGFYVTHLLKMPFCNLTSLEDFRIVSESFCHLALPNTPFFARRGYRETWKYSSPRCNSPTSVARPHLVGNVHVRARRSFLPPETVTCLAREPQASSSHGGLYLVSGAVSHTCILRSLCCIRIYYCVEYPMKFLGDWIPIN